MTKQGFLSADLKAAVTRATVSATASAWNAHQAKEFLTTRLPELLQACPPEDVISPDPAIAGPAIEVLRHVLHEPVLSDLVASLLATAIDKNRSSIALPAFVDVIRNLSADEAILIGYFSKDVPLPLIDLRWDYKTESGKQGGKEVLLNFSHFAQHAQCRHPLLAATYTDNLRRLGLIEIPAFYQYADNDAYAAMIADPLVNSLIAEIQADTDRAVAIERKGLRLTAMGRQFIHACVNRNSN